MPRSSMTLTLTTGGTKYQLATLIAAIDANTRKSFNEITIQADNANTDTVKIGDGSLSATDFAVELIAGDTQRYASGDGMSSRSTEPIYLISATNAMKVHFSGKE